MLARRFASVNAVWYLQINKLNNHDLGLHF